ncbi:hypothetical protein PS914_03777 [Pseudomonas fluorescens]|uniref:hypothetical protein n=1 Tax=Pseudomonas fluorescens TaxID=294 RepID=UPI00123EFF20|nr:hypothetical protein [Pseudomonas fluorescens]VVP98045.1 hypothetical protein PS914_03777 [Pseudomonas fluorescens]
MSDLLLALARRSLQPPAIRPRIGSRFENDARVPRDVESAPPSPPAFPREPPTSTVPQPVLVQPIPEPSTPMPPVTPVLRRVASLLQPTPSAATIPPPTPGPPQSVVSPAIAAPKEAGLSRIALPLSPVVDTAQAQSLLRLETRLIERSHSEQRIERHELSRELIERRVERLHEQAPNATAASQPLHARQEPRPPQVDGQAAAPRVEITIGRIEILSHEAAPAARREEPPRRLPAKSLDDYLSERNTGAGPRS